jgi:glycosyltransferase involved in cell wall biosynthesis
VASRIRCFYGRDAEVIYPPVDTSWISAATPGSSGEAFLYAGALVPYKRPELVVRVMNKLGEKLWIAGSGPEEGKLRRIAGSNVTFLGRVSDAELAGLYRRCRALLFPGVEDFGMIPVECMAAGRPVIALREGGTRETVLGIEPSLPDGIAEQAATGVFIPKEPDPQRSLEQAVRRFLEVEDRLGVEACVKQAALFSPERFLSSWRGLLLRHGYSLPDGALSAA